MQFPRAFLLLLTFFATSAAFAQSDWDQVRTAYGLLTHVAGAGADQDANSWFSGYEGGNALTAELSRSCSRP